MEPPGGTTKTQADFILSSNQKIVECLLVGCLTSQQHAGVSQGRICCCRTEIEVADQTFYNNNKKEQQQNTHTHTHTHTHTTSPSHSILTPDRPVPALTLYRQAPMTRPRQNPAQAGFEPGIFCSRGGRLTTRSTRW